jgi:hypothetical protein
MSDTIHTRLPMFGKASLSLGCTDGSGSATTLIGSFCLGVSIGGGVFTSAKGHDHQNGEYTGHVLLGFWFERLEIPTKLVMGDERKATR